MTIKHRIYLIACLCFGLGQINAQSQVYKSVQVNHVLTNYSVTATYDTTYVTEVVMMMTDTVGFQNLSASLSIQTPTGWQTITTNTLTKPVTTTACNTPLCFYRRNETEWVLYLGAYSLYTRHKIELQFNTVYTDTSNAYWDDEF